MTQFAKKFQEILNRLLGYVDRLWYAPALSLLAALDNLVIFIPTDGLLISSAMIKPKRWFHFALLTAIGSTLGALVLAFLVEELGLPTLLQYYPNLDQTKTWNMVQEFFGKYGLLCVFAISASPLIQQPAVIIASLAMTPYYQLAIVIFSGRFLKFMLFSYIGSHAPKLLNKIWGMKSELEAFKNSDQPKT